MSRQAEETAANAIRAAVLKQDRAVFGGWLAAPSSDLLAAFGTSALDYIGIDCQHGGIEEAAVARLISGAGTAGPGRIVRVAANRPELIGRVLDGGADGVIVPAVESADEARRIVAAVNFPPLGTRSYGPMASFLPRDPQLLAQRALVLPMIETRAGLENVAEILAVDGVDGIYVGPSDLGLSLGLSHLQFPATAELERALEPVVRAGRDLGKILGIHAAHESFCRRYVELGFRLLTLGAAASFVVAGVEQVLERAGRPSYVAKSPTGAY